MDFKTTIYHLGRIGVHMTNVQLIALEAEFKSHEAGDCSLASNTPQNKEKADVDDSTSNEMTVCPSCGRNNYKSTFNVYG